MATISQVVTIISWSYTAGIRPPSATRDKVTVSVVLQRESDQARSRTTHNHDRSCMTARFDVMPKTAENSTYLAFWGKPLRDTATYYTFFVGAVVQLVQYRTRNQEVAGSTHTRSAASNLEQVANLLRAQANSASYPQRDGK